MIEKRVGKPLNVVVLPEPRAVGPFDEQLMSEYEEMFYQHTEPQILDSSRFESAFGVAPTPLGDTLDATLAWYGEWLARQ
jgi:nucleoside-diphosphate-sugar epimerase